MAQSLDLFSIFTYSFDDTTGLTIYESLCTLIFKFLSLAWISPLISDFWVQFPSQHQHLDVLQASHIQHDQNCTANLSRKSASPRLPHLYKKRHWQIFWFLRPKTLRVNLWTCLLLWHLIIQTIFKIDSESDPFSPLPLQSLWSPPAFCHI